MTSPTDAATFDEVLHHLRQGDFTLLAPYFSVARVQHPTGHAGIDALLRPPQS